MNRKEKNNRANMRNPNHPAFWKSRGYYRRPDNWEAKMRAEKLKTPLIDTNCNNIGTNTITKRDVGCQYEPPQEEPVTNDANLEQGHMLVDEITENGDDLHNDEVSEKENIENGEENIKYRPRIIS